MPLSDLQRKMLIDKINNINLQTVLNYFQSGEISFKDVPHINPDRKAWIEELLNNMPNPVEQREWEAIVAISANLTQGLLAKLDAYITKWSQSRPSGNHVDEAEEMRRQVDEELKKQAREAEENEWNNVDPFSMQRLIGYLKKYPGTVHRDEIDDSIWSLTNYENIQEIKDYINLFPEGKHVGEANWMLKVIVDWITIKNTGDIFTINGYMSRNPQSPFKSQVELEILRLKQEELSSMQMNPNAYDITRLKRLVDEKLVSCQELVNAGVMTPTVFDTIMNSDANYLPDINSAIDRSRAECKEGYTDVFFFGIPSTGKTCVLMGLSRASTLHVNLASESGDYAEVLQLYIDAGITVPPTPGTFVTALEADIRPYSDGRAVHKVNLVEMSGEEFAFEIAKNPQRKVSFEEMGSGATNLLSNGNNKVFFLIIDPTATRVRISRSVVDHYNEETGEPVSTIETCIADQKIMIQKLVDLFREPSNAEIMRRVDSIHIIMTKADTLGNDVERETRALDIFNKNFSNSILHPLVELCEEFNINVQTKFTPKLYTFSLGTFYVGGYYEYDSTDSDRLVNAIVNSTHGLKKKSWWDRLKEKVN